MYHQSYRRLCQHGFMFALSGQIYYIAHTDGFVAL